MSAPWTGPRLKHTHEQLSRRQDPGPTWTDARSREALEMDLRNAKNTHGMKRMEFRLAEAHLADARDALAKAGRAVDLIELRIQELSEERDEHECGGIGA